VTLSITVNRWWYLTPTKEGDKQIKIFIKTFIFACPKTNQRRQPVTWPAKAGYPVLLTKHGRHRDDASL
jgi:hypothetical protein